MGRHDLRWVAFRDTPRALAGLSAQPIPVNMARARHAALSSPLLSPPTLSLSPTPDEGHKLKNPRMLLRQQLDALPCRLRVLISGTPIQVGRGGWRCKSWGCMVRGPPAAPLPRLVSYRLPASLPPSNPPPAEQPARDVGALQLLRARRAGRRGRLQVQAVPCFRSCVWLAAPPALRLPPAALMPPASSPPRPALCAARLPRRSRYERQITLGSDKHVTEYERQRGASAAAALRQVRRGWEWLCVCAQALHPSSAHNLTHSCLPTPSPTLQPTADHRPLHAAPREEGGVQAAQ